MNQNINLLYESLILSLGQEYEQYEALLKTLKDETLILRKSSLESILENNTRKEMIILSLNMAAEMRKKAMKKIASHFRLEEPLSLTKIIAHAKGDARQSLLDYQEKFADAMSKIKKLNEDNKNLITFSLAHIRNTFNYISNLLASNPHYDHHGQIKAENLQGRLISQAG